MEEMKKTGLVSREYENISKLLVYLILSDGLRDGVVGVVKR